MSSVCLRRIRNVYLSYDGICVVHPGAGRKETAFPGLSNVGLCLRSSSCEYVALQFDRSKGERHFEEVMRGLLENASTIAAKEVFFKHAILTRAGLALTKRLVESLTGVRHVDYGTCFRVTFPDVSFEQAVRDLEASLKTANRLMDDEIIDFCKKKSPEDSHRSLTFSQVAVTKDLFRTIVEMRLNDELPEEFELRIISPYNNPDQELGDFQSVLENPQSYCHTYAVMETDLKLSQDGDDERDYNDARIWNYSFSEEKYAIDDD